MRVKDLIPKDEFKSPNSVINTDFCAVSANHKKAQPRCLLFLQRGVSFDTTALIPDFLAASPGAIVCEDASAFPKTDIPLIEVNCARRAYAYARCAIENINFGRCVFIGVTGTNGKTTTATMIYRILKHAGKRCGLIGTGVILLDGEEIAPDGYTMTSPDPDLLYPTIKRMTDYGCDAIVMEASSHALMLSKLDPIPFDIGIFTGLSHEHLDFHGSMDSYFEAKERLIKNAKRVIINFDDPKGKILYDKYRDKATGIGVVFRSDTNAENVESRGLSGIGYIYRKRSFLTRVRLPLPGIYNIYNSMLAFECAYKLNVPPATIREALASLAPIDGRCECIRDEVTVVIDYAHTPFALENLLRCAAEERSGGHKLHTIFGCGGERDREKRPLMAQVAEKYSDRITVTSDNPRSEDPERIIADIVAGFRDTRHSVISERSEAIRNAILCAGRGDIIVIAGKGHERYVCDKNGYHHFDEREIIFSALKVRKERG